MQLEREFRFEDEDFEALRKLVQSVTGISLSQSKRDLVYSRLARRLRHLDLTTFEDYRAFLEQDEHERVEFINAITTNLTSFFREAHHFEYLEQTLLPEISRERCVRAWSAGCSTGEEPYSIAMAALGTLPPGFGVKILATDLDTRVLETARGGVYPVERAAPVPERHRRWLRRGKGPQAGWCRVSPQLQSVVHFKRLNLIESWPMRGKFDFIFCRNVVIYFSKDVQRTLFDRYADALVPGGLLFLGHSESMYQLCERFQPLGKTIYRRVS